MEKKIQIKISTEHNEKLESMLNRIKESEPLARVKKQNLVECAIERLKESDALSVAARCINPKAKVLEYLKKDKNLSDPQALIDLIQTKVSA